MIFRYTRWWSKNLLPSSCSSNSSLHHQTSSRQLIFLRPSTVEATTHSPAVAHTTGSPLFESLAVCLLSKHERRTNTSTAFSAGRSTCFANSRSRHISTGSAAYAQCTTLPNPIRGFHLLDGHQLCSSHLPASRIGFCRSTLSPQPYILDRLFLHWSCKQHGKRRRSTARRNASQSVGQTSRQFLHSLAPLWLLDASQDSQKGHDQR